MKFGPSNIVPQTPEELARQEASIASIASGGLPLNAVDRLKDLASRQDTPRHLFSSDLSASEFMLTRECGFQALGQVMGSAVFIMGMQYTPGISGELRNVVDAQMQARNRAMDRLKAEAAILGGTGVIGVRIERREVDEELHLTEFSAVGTAVRPIGSKAQAGEPFLSGLNGQDHWALRQAGYRPLGFAFGISSYYQASDWHDSARTNLAQNKELTYLTEGFYVCREIASGRLAEDCRRLGALGVVGVTVETRSHMTGTSSNSTGLVVHFTTYGTAVAREAGRSDEQTIIPMISVKD